MMRIAIGVALALLCATAARAEPSDHLSSALRIGSGNVLLGKQKIRSENCQECHGEFGIGLSNAAPKLAGQYADYLIKQLHDFQSGARRHPVMNAMADGLSEDDMADIAAYFASNPVMHGEPHPPQRVAQELFLHGDAKRNVLPCQSCHGASAQGKFAPTECYPVLGGQYAIYLREQLINWRSGTRHNSPSGVMNVIAHSLSDDEIAALAEYLSGL
jgi:cytochrome c553